VDELPREIDDSHSEAYFTEGGYSGNDLPHYCIDWGVPGNRHSYRDPDLTIFSEVR